MAEASLSKAEIRRAAIAARKALKPEARRAADAAINAAIMGFEGFGKAPLVAAYSSDGTEPDLKECMEAVLKSGRRLCLPRFGKAEKEYCFAEVRSLESGLVKGSYGLEEPGPEAKAVPASDLKLALWLVPGVAFDANGGRLGRGKGVYDRLLARGCGMSIGVFYECQKCGALPLEGHDFGLDMIATEAGLWKAPRGKQGDLNR